MRKEYSVLLKTETITELLMSFVVLSSMSLINIHVHSRIFEDVHQTVHVLTYFQH